MKRYLTRIVCGLALLLPAILTAQVQAGSKVNLNPPHGDAAYDAFTVLSPDAVDPAAARKDVIVVFHGFTSALPNGTYKRVRKFFKKTHTVIGVNYDPLDIGRTLAFLDSVQETWLKGRNTTVFGTSLGAFWADVFGARIEAQKIVLLNPVTQPERQLARYVGKEKTNKRRVQTFLVEAAALDRYAGLDGTAAEGLSRLVVLTADDESLDFRDALQVYAGRNKTTVVVYPEGGHTMDLRKHPARRFIVDFVSNE